MKKLLCLPILLFWAPFLYAQVATEMAWHPIDTTNNNSHKDFLFAFQVGAPSREMRPAIHNQMGDVGFGAGMLFLSDPFTWGKDKRGSALRLGGGLGYTYYGRFKTPVRIANYDGRLKTAYGILDAKAIARFRPELGRGISPFADIQAGTDLYMSDTRDDLDAIESQLGIEPVSWDNTISASFTKGIGGGLAIGSADPKKAKVVIRVTYNWGSRIKYVVRNSLQYHQSENTLTYEQGKAPVRYILFQVGVGL